VLVAGTLQNLSSLHFLDVYVQISQTGGQQYNDTSPLVFPASSIFFSNRWRRESLLASLRHENARPSLHRLQRDDEPTEGRQKFWPQIRLPPAGRGTLCPGRHHVGQDRRALRVRRQAGPALRPERSGRSGVRHRDHPGPVCRRQANAVFEGTWGMGEKFIFADLPQGPEGLLPPPWSTESFYGFRQGILKGEYHCTVDLLFD